MKKLICCTAAILLSGCATTNRLPPVTINKPAPVEKPILAPTQLNHVDWKVRDLAGLKQLVAEMEANGQTDVILYVLPQDQFNILAMNLSEMKRYIADQRVANDFLFSTLDINQKPVTTEK